MWQVNYLSHALLTDLLLPLLKASKPSRVVHVSSEAHRKGASPNPGADVTSANWTGLQGTEAALQQRRLRHHMFWGASGHGTYADAKLLVMMHSLRLARTVPEVSSLSVDPGSSVAIPPDFTKYLYQTVAIAWRFVAPAVGIIPVHESESVNAQLHASASVKFDNVTGLYLTPNLGPFENCQSCMEGRFHDCYRSYLLSPLCATKDPHSLAMSVDEQGKVWGWTQELIRAGESHAETAAKRAEEEKLRAEQEKQAAAAVAAAAKRAEEERVAAEAAAKKKAEEAKAAEAKRKEEEKRAAEAKKKQEEEKAAEAKRKAEEARLAEEKRKKEEDKRKKEEEKRKKQEEKRKKEEEKVKMAKEAEAKAAEAKRKEEEAQKKKAEEARRQEEEEAQRKRAEEAQRKDAEAQRQRAEQERRERE